MTRRSLVLGALAGPARPNILWLSSEDTSPTLGCYGDAYASTPNLDRFAAQSVRYAHAYTVAGVCAPSRSGIITGMYPSTLGSQHMRCDARLPPHVRCFPAFLRDAGYHCSNNAKTDYNFAVPKDAWDALGRNAHYKDRKPGQPFFAVFNHEVSHESRINYRGKDYDDATRGLPPEQRHDPAKAPLPPYHPDSPKVRKDWATYYDMVSAMDAQIGAKLKALEDEGLLDDTIVFYWGDHGNGLPRAKRWLYESGTHVPLMVRIPAKFRAGGQGKPGTVDTQLVSMIDLAPTVLNLAGVPLAPQFQGRAFLGPRLTKPREFIYGARDRMDERYDIIRMVRDKRYRYIRNYDAGKPYYQHMSTPEGSDTMKELRRMHAARELPPAAELFMAGSKPPEELYDTQADRHEIRNLAADPKHRAALERMRKAHLAWMRETLDVGLLPEPELESREKRHGSRYAILRAPENAGLQDRLLRVHGADEAGKRAALSDPDPAVRWWAARGLKSGLDAVLGDASAVVRIAAAANVGPAAIPVLTRELKNELPSARLMAMQALDAMGKAAKPAEAEIRAALDDENRYVPRVATHALAAMR